METAALDAYLQTGGIAQAAEVLGWDEKRVYNALQRVRNKVKALFVSH
jgi:transposase-like protein